MYSSFSQGDFTYQKALEIYFEEMESRPDKSDA